MATSTTAFVAIEEYLDSADYQPDVNYVDGEIEERHMGEYEHAAWQEAARAWFRQDAKDWGIRNLPEYRVQVAQTRLLVPDVTITYRTVPVEKIAVTAPLAGFGIEFEMHEISKLVE
jgi:hypothetical protein